MKMFYPFELSFFSGVKSIFDLSGSNEIRNYVPRGPNSDMNQLSNDQERLLEDYEKAFERAKANITEDQFE